MYLRLRVRYIQYVPIDRPEVSHVGAATRQRTPLLILAAAVMVFAGTLLYYVVLPNNGYTGKVRIIVPAEFRSRFPDLDGSVMVAMAGPEGFESYIVPLDDLVGVARDFDFSETVSSWARYVSSGEWPSLKESGASVPLPTVTVTFFLHDGEGNEYLAAMFYGPIKYFMEKGYGEIGAAKKALKDPLAHFRRRLPLAIRIDLRELELSMVKYNLAPALEELKGIQPGEKPSNLGFEPGTCPDGAEPYWAILYESRDTPPGWMQHIANVENSTKKELWQELVSTFGAAYYFDARLTLKQVLSKVYTRAFMEGVWRVDSLLRRLYEKRYGRLPEPGGSPQWLDSQQPGTVMELELPYLGIEAYFHRYEPISISVFMTRFPLVRSVKGISFLGKPVYGVEMTALAVGAGSLPVSDRTVYRKVYLAVPVDYLYEGDGVFVTYDVEKVEVPGCGYYWRVVPLIGFLPVYMVSGEHVEEHRILAVESPYGPDPESLKLVAWSRAQVELYHNASLTTRGEELLYEESNLNVKEVFKEKVGGLTLNLLKPWVLETITSSIGEPGLDEFFLQTVANYLSFTHSGMGPAALVLGFDVWSETTIADVHLEVLKWTLKHRVSYYDELGYAPTMIVYKCIIREAHRGEPGAHG